MGEKESGSGGAPDRRESGQKENVVEIRGVTKTYGKRRGIEDISLCVKSGDIFGFLGPNGAGKSTTIRSMLGMLHFQKGEIRLLGLDVKTQQPEILRRVGYMPSEAMFYPSMRVKEVIRFAAQARKTDCRREADRICEILEVDRENLSEVKRYCKNAAIIREGRLIRTDTVENLAKSDLRRVKVRAGGREQEFVHTGDMQGLLRRLYEMAPEDVLIEEPSLEELFMHYYEEPQGQEISAQGPQILFEEKRKI